MHIFVNIMGGNAQYNNST